MNETNSPISSDFGDQVVPKTNYAKPDGNGFAFSPWEKQPENSFIPNAPSNRVPENKENSDPKKQKSKVLISLILVVTLALIVSGGMLIYKNWSGRAKPVTTNTANLANGVKPLWKKPAELIFTGKTDNFTPYTVAVPDNETTGNKHGDGSVNKDRLNVIPVVVMPSEDGSMAQSQELNPTSGKPVGTPQPLETCDFNAAKHYEVVKGKIKCVNISNNTEWTNNTMNNSSSSSVKADNSKTDLPGVQVYQDNQVQVRVTPLNGDSAEQILGYRTKNKELLWIYDLEQGGEVTGSADMIFVTRIINDTVTVQAFGALSKPNSAKADPQKVKNLAKDAIKQVDVQNLVYPRAVTDQQCPENNNIYKLKKKTETEVLPSPLADTRGACWTLMVNGETLEQEEESEPGIKQPVQVISEIKKSGVNVNSRESQTADGGNPYLDLNGDGYLDTIAAGGEYSVLSYWVYIFNPNDPKHPYIFKIVGSKTDDVHLSFANNLLTIEKGAGYQTTDVVRFFNRDAKLYAVLENSTTDGF